MFRRAHFPPPRCRLVSQDRTTWNEEEQPTGLGSSSRPPRLGRSELGGSPHVPGVAWAQASGGREDTDSELEGIEGSMLGR